ncbi:MAG: NAD(P)/FAD-dependent oxidoreductase [Ruegeria sp.]
MRRIFPSYTYGPGPRAGCWWDETVSAPDWPEHLGDTSIDVAVVGGGFTGVSAALHLAENGTEVAVFEAETPGWGASGRNGGFCCQGGSKLTYSALVRRYGIEGARAYAQAEEDAVSLVANLMARFGIDADVHSEGETQLAHNTRAMEKLRRRAQQGGRLHEAEDLAYLGMSGRFFGGYTDPVGFGLNPQKYLFGLASAARSFGANLFANSPVRHIRKTESGFLVETPKGRISAANVLICTNGYSSEDLPNWLSARYMPAQSTAMVTRPLSKDELKEQGWTSRQIAYDTRNLLHYFRLMPDNRFLFGMRGGLMSSKRAEVAIRKTVHRDFCHMFPRWADVEVTHMWSGMVCLARDLVPFAGPVPDHPGMFAGFAYHGNGVAMGTYCGRVLSRMVLGQTAEAPDPISRPPKRFPFGRWRRLIMPPAYAAMAVLDL